MTPEQMRAVWAAAYGAAYAMEINRMADANGKSVSQTVTDDYVTTNAAGDAKRIADAAVLGLRHLDGP